jgi:hypothetical protein
MHAPRRGREAAGDPGRTDKTGMGDVIRGVITNNRFGDDRADPHPEPRPVLKRRSATGEDARSGAQLPRLSRQLQ